MTERMTAFCARLDRMTAAQLRDEQRWLRAQYEYFVAHDRPAESDDEAWNCVIALIEIQKRMM